MRTPAPTILPLESTSASLQWVGGKARSLAALAAAGLPVPKGFLVSTMAYQNFVDANALQKSILRIVASEAAEQASANIRALFDGARLPEEIAASIRQAYAALGEDEPAVAVRSSATAEDLPDLSFAGQQDTYLNVSGDAALLEAIRQCWASLWTARAIDYRGQMNIDQRAVAMGVIVQVMVNAEVSGILFTANPTTGDRSELIVNASFGLGEAIVGGQVTPDTYVLDRGNFQTKETVVGAKQTMVVSTGKQGTLAQPVPETLRGDSSLSRDNLTALASLAMSAEQLFAGQPQDIEWAVADGKCWLLQSRPITNLPAAPLLDVRWDPPVDCKKLIRRQVVENMPDPLSPLFAELYLNEGLDRSMDELMTNFGAPFSIDDFIQRPMFLTVNGYAYCRADYPIRWRLLRILPKVLFWTATSMPKIMRSAVPHWHDEALPGYLATIEQWKGMELRTASDEQLLSGVRALTVADAMYWFDVAIVVGMAKVTDGLLHSFLASRAVRGNLTSGMFLNGFASHTLQAQEDLEAIARRIRAKEPLRERVIATPAGHLLEALEQHDAASPVLADIRLYLAQYGHQIYTLDFVQPTQAEDPLPVLLSLKTLVKRADYDTAARRGQMARDRELLETRTSESLGPLRRWLFRKFLGWAQRFGPNREQALFYMGAAWPTLRGFALELGERLVQAGTLAASDDVFYLESVELADACAARRKGRGLPDQATIAHERRELREARKLLHPPAMVPEDSRFKFGPFDFSAWETQKRNADDADTMNGFAVSPGQVTGSATVILSPADFAEMQPDTILVCATTTPAWTPLFAQASGLVTDIGGILAHGSIVAREYGIPAVLGTGNATQRIVSGQRIAVDGDKGTVTIIG
ncbi:MAG: PEP-utilizing enzyme [Gammaproteobacteria bacterium]|nr:PEP-utilizing enzyme [Gammaproteobacteria bacterium]